MYHHPPRNTEADVKRRVLALFIELTNNSQLLGQIQQFVALTIAIEHKVKMPPTFGSAVAQGMPMNGPYNSTFGTGRVTPNLLNAQPIGSQNIINATLLNNVLSSLSSGGGGGYTNLQRELYNLL